MHPEPSRRMGENEDTRQRTSDPRDLQRRQRLTEREDAQNDRDDDV
jgi:hypothetical protein